MLTNKCKSDFEVRLKEQPVAPYVQMFDSIPLIVQQAYLLQFFDAAEIYIEVNIVHYKKSKAWIYTVDDYDHVEMFETREEALNKGIELANEIYNENVNR